MSTRNQHRSAILICAAITGAVLVAACSERDRNVRIECGVDDTVSVVLEHVSEWGIRDSSIVVEQNGVRSAYNMRPGDLCEEIRE